MAHNPDSRTYAAFTAAVLIGGANFVGVTVSNAELPPMFGAMLRFALAGVLLLIIARLTRVPLPRGRSALGAAVYGVLAVGAAYACMYYALVGLSAGVAAVIVAAVPLFTLVISVLVGQERLTARGVIGGVLAIIGIAVLSLGTLGGDIAASYLIAAIGGAIAIAASSVVAKSLPQVHPVSMNAIGMMTGTVLLAAASVLLGEAWSLPRERQTWLALGWLVVLGSIGLFQLVLYVIRRWTASATMYVPTGMPVVAAILGAVLLDQAITPELLAGGALVVAAVYVGAISAGRQSPHVVRYPGGSGQPDVEGAT